MRELIFALLFVLNNMSVFSQVTSKNDTIPAKFNGTADIREIREYLQKSMVYPPSSIMNGEQGAVVIKFQITSEAKIDSLELLNSVSFAVDLEVINRLLMTESSWTSAQIGEEKISVNFIIPFFFRVESFATGLKSYINKGNKSYAKMDYQSSFNHFTMAIKLNPFNVEILKKKIDCEKKLHKLSDLERDIKLLEFVEKSIPVAIIR